jgi:hypothetical protein
MRAQAFRRFDHRVEEFRRGSPGPLEAVQDLSSLVKVITGDLGRIAQPEDFVRDDYLTATPGASR